MKYKTANGVINISKLLYLRGKVINLFNKNDFLPYKMIRGDGSITDQGDSWGTSNLVKCKPSTTYTLYCPYPNATTWAGFNRVGEYDSNQQWLRMTYSVYSTANIRLITFTTSEDCEYFRVGLMNGNATSGQISGWSTCGIRIFEGSYTLTNIPDETEYDVPTSIFFSIRSYGLKNENNNLWTYLSPDKMYNITVGGTSKDSDNGEQKHFELNTWYRDFYMNDLYYPSWNAVKSYVIDKNYISTFTTNATGLARKFNCTPGNTYTFSAEEMSDDSALAISFYTEDGYFISNALDKSSVTLTAPENAAYFMALFRSSPPLPAFRYVRNLQLVESSTKPDGYQQHNHIEFR